MRSFQSLLLIFLSLFSIALAGDYGDDVYDATVYVTSTVYRINTITLHSSPTASLYNSTSTFAPSNSAPTLYPTSNGTSTLNAPTGPVPTPSEFPGAANAMAAPAFFAAVAAVVGVLAL